MAAGGGEAGGFGVRDLVDHSMIWRMCFKEVMLSTSFPGRELNQDERIVLVREHCRSIVKVAASKQSKGYMLFKME